MRVVQMTLAEVGEKKLSMPLTKRSPRENDNMTRHANYQNFSHQNNNFTLQVGFHTSHFFTFAVFI
jgi:hypothetical protein